MISASPMAWPISSGALACAPQALSTPMSSLILLATAEARWIFRDVTTTFIPSIVYKRAATCPTGPVPAKTVAFFPLKWPNPFSLKTARVFATAADAVVYAPRGSTITASSKGGNMDFFATSKISIAFSMFCPPMKTLVCFAPFGPRGNMASWIIFFASSGSTLL